MFNIGRAIIVTKTRLHDGYYVVIKNRSLHNYLVDDRAYVICNIANIS